MASTNISLNEAFDSYDVDMRIEADDVTITIPAEGVMSSVEKQVNSYGIAPSLVIDMERLSVEEIVPELPESSLTSVSVPQALNINVKSLRKTDAVYYTDQDMTLEMKTSSRYQVYDKEMAVYVKDSRADWNKVEGAYDRYQAAMTFETPKVGTYSLFTYDRNQTLTNNQKPSHWSESYRQAVFSQMTVEGLTSYNPDAYVTAAVVAQAVNATVMGAPSVDLSAVPDTIFMQTLVRAGIAEGDYSLNAALRREEALAMFARTYEIANGNVEVSQSELAAAASTAGVDSDKALSIAKAKKIGLFSDLGTLRANDSMTYGEFFTVWSRVLGR